MIESDNPSTFWPSGGQTTPTVIPGLRYRDAKAAIEFLIRAFGFERKLVVDNDAGSVRHAELVHGNGMVMLGEASEDHGSASSIYIVVDDPVAHCATARAAGAQIVVEPHEPDYGGKIYTAADLEGNRWHFGSYDPFAPTAAIHYSEDDATGVIEIRVAGRVDARSFERVAEKMEAFFERHDEARIVEVIEAFEGMDWSLLFDDVLFSLRHMRRFTHVAVVTDLRWAERMTNAAALVMPAKVRLFPLDDLEAARRWATTATA